MENALGLVTILSQFTPDPGSKHSLAVQKSVFLARRLQERAAVLQTPSERRQQAELDRMLQHPSDKATLAQMTDQAFRSHDPGRAVHHLIHILDVQGIPRFFSPWDRALLKGFQTFGGYAPGIAFPLVKEHMQKETAQRHSARREGDARAPSSGAHPGGRADERQFPRRGDFGRR